MDIIPVDYYVLGLWIGIALQVVFAIFFRRQLAGLFDIFFLNLIYISFGLSGLILVYAFNQSLVVLGEIFLMAVWLFGMYWGCRLRMSLTGRCFVRVTASILPSKAKSSSMDWAAFLIVALIYLLYILQIMRSGILFLDSSLIDSRFLVQEDNKIQGYLFSAVGLIPAVILFRIWPRLSVRVFLLAITPFWIVQALTFSKTGFLFPVIAGALYFSLGVKSGWLRRPRMPMQVGALVSLVLAVYFIFMFITVVVIETDVSPLEVMLNRLFSSFDGLVHLSTISFKSEGSLSLFQWYFSPFLKVLGLFDQKYNAFNYVLAVEFFGYGYDHTGMLPNNNHIGEIISTYPPQFRVLVAMMSGVIYGGLLSKAYRIIRDGGALVLPAAFVVATPFGFLIDGQGWFTALLCACLLVIPMLLLSKVLMIFRRSLRRLNSHGNHFVILNQTN